MSILTAENGVVRAAYGSIRAGPAAHLVPPHPPWVWHQDTRHLPGAEPGHGLGVGQGFGQLEPNPAITLLGQELVAPG